MREMKCKAWDETHKDWVDYGFCLRFDADGKCEILNAFAQPFPDRVLILVWWTNQKDKHGKDIYEGDILYLESSYLKRYEVYWNEDRWGLKHGYEDYDSGDYYRGDDINNWDEWEITGNIYENPELLEAR